MNDSSPQSFAESWSVNESTAPASGPSSSQAPTLGCWGLAHLTASRSSDGGPRLVGRELESFRLLHALETARCDHLPTLVTISAPSGMGKTRLIDETLFMARLSGYAGRVFSVAALPGDQSNAVLARLIRTRFAIELGDDPVTQQTVLREELKRILGNDRVDDMCVFLGKLLAVNFDQTPLSKAFADDPFRTELAVESLFCELFVSDADRAPLCLVFEDLQHADPDSLAALMALLDKLAGSCAVICSARPEFFARYEHFNEFAAIKHEHIELAGLDSSEIRVLMRQLLGPSAGDNRRLQRYVQEGSLGNPGLVQRLCEELWSDRALEVEKTGEALSIRFDRLTPCDELNERGELVETRLCALPRDERLALEASVVAGSSCWRGMWIKLMQAQEPKPAITSEAGYDDLIERLLRGGHLLKLPDSRIEGETEYIFKQPHERDLLLRQVTVTRKRAYHHIASDWLDCRAETRQRSDLAALRAWHLQQCGSSYRSALAYLEAGRLARIEGSASGIDAATYLYQGLQALGELDNVRRVNALHDYGAVLVDLGCPSAARAVFSSMRDLAAKLGLPSKEGAALNRLGRVHRESGELTSARQYFERASRAFASAGDERGLSATKDDLGKLLLLEGDVPSALPLLRSGFEARRSSGDGRSLGVSLVNLALAWEERGKRNEAEQAISVAQQLFSVAGDTRGSCDALLARGQVATHRHDFYGAELHFSSAVELATSACDRARLAKSLIELGKTKLREHDLAAAEPLLERAARLAESIDSRLDLAEAERVLAKLELKQNRPRAARRHIRSALGLARRSHSRRQLAATLRVLAEVAAAGAWSASTKARAANYYTLGIEFARQTNNDLELAKLYSSFARYAELYERSELREQSEILRGLSNQIFERHARAS